MKTRWLAVLLAACLCLGLLPAAFADTPYNDSINAAAVFDACYDFFAGNEGHYDSVVAKDVNAVSIGRLQWHGPRAHALLKMIVQKNPSKLALVLSDGLIGEILNQTDASWNNRSLTAAEAAQVQAAIASREGIEAQDALAHTDIYRYIQVGWNAGFRSNATLLYYAYVINQYGEGGAKTWLGYIRQTMGISEGTTISSVNALHTAALNTSAGYVSNYISARKRAYAYLSNLGWNMNGPDAPMEYTPALCSETHTWTEPVLTQAPTCIAVGFTKTACANCDTVSRDPVPKGGHVWNGGTVLQAPTCTAGGSVKYTCTLCGETMTSPTAALGHSFGSDGRCVRCGAAMPYPSACFTDVPAGAWYREAVDYALSHGFFAGTSETTFSPGVPMNRAMLVTVVYAMAGKPYVDNGGRKIFDDVPVNSYYFKPVLWASVFELIDGVSESSFAPKKAITREQLILILYRFAGYNGLAVPPSRPELNDFADGDEVSGWALEAMLWAVENGVLAGSEADGRRWLHPGAGATRAEVAQILMSFSEKIK